MKKKSINRKFSNSSLRQSKNKMKGGADAVNNPTFTMKEFTEKAAEEEKTNKILTRETMIKILSNKRKKYEDITSVTIPDGIVIIGPECFSFYKNLKKILLPKSVLFIKNYAFLMCFFLKNIVMPGVLLINENAFNNCISLTNVIGNNVREIKTEAFNNCISLQNASFPSATTIERHVFVNCFNIKGGLHINLSKCNINKDIIYYTANPNIENVTIYCGEIREDEIKKNSEILNKFTCKARIKHTIVVTEDEGSAGSADAGGSAVSAVSAGLAVAAENYCLVEHTWRNGDDRLEERKVLYANINLPILLVALGGNKYLVYNWTDPTVNFMELVNKQYNALPVKGWSFLIPGEDEEINLTNLLKTLDWNKRTELLLKLVDDGDYLYNNPWFLVYDDNKEIAPATGATRATRAGTAHNVVQKFEKIDQLLKDRHAVLTVEEQNKFLATEKAEPRSVIPTIPDNFFDGIKWDTRWGPTEPENWRDPDHYYLDVSPNPDNAGSMGGGKTKKKMKGGKRFKKSKKK